MKKSQVVFLGKIFIYKLNSISKCCTKNCFSWPLLTSLFSIKKITNKGKDEQEKVRLQINQKATKIGSRISDKVYLNQIQYYNWISISLHKILKVTFGGFILQVLPRD